MRSTLDYLFGLAKAVNYSPASNGLDRARLVAEMEERNLENTKTKLAEQSTRLSINDAYLEVTREVDRTYDSNLF